MAALWQLTNVSLSCGAVPHLVTARDSPAMRVKMARLESDGGLHVKETSAVERPKRMSVVSNAVSVEAEKELELNIANDVTQGLEAPGTLGNELAPAIEEKTLLPAPEEEAAAPVEEGPKTTRVVEETELLAAAEEEASTPVEVDAAASDEKSLAVEEKELPIGGVEEGSAPEEDAPVYSETAPVAEEKDMPAPLEEEAALLVDQSPVVEEKGLPAPFNERRTLRMMIF